MKTAYFLKLIGCTLKQGHLVRLQTRNNLFGLLQVQIVFIFTDEAGERPH